MSKEQWEHIGMVCVDSGMIMIIDPCYAANINGFLRDKKWKDFCNFTFEQEEKGKHEFNLELFNGISAIAFGISDDGHYPVSVKRNEKGKIKEIKICIE